MVQEILQGLYKIDVPIPNNPLKALNCYVFQSYGETLVVDTGFNRKECFDALFGGLSVLGVNPGKTKVFITHMHADHCGLVAELVKEGAEPYCSREDATVINSGEAHFLQMDVFARTGGFPPAELADAIHKHPGYRFRPLEYVEFTAVEDGDILTLGDYSFTCIKTPGHTRGHVCLYEKQKKLLVSGDHILQDITPNISLWSDRHDPLLDYLCSLDKVKELDADLVLPGHRSLITDMKRRIEELQEHHRIRAEEVMSIVCEKPRNAYEVAARMTWDLTYDVFEDFPIAQKWFAAGEALAHLKFLEGQNRIRRVLRDGVVVFHAGGLDKKE